MTKHANLPPSGSGRWVLCPGSIALVEAIPAEYRKPSGHFAQLGTAAHGLLERCLTKGEEPSGYLGRIIELIGEDEDVSILKPKAKAPKDPARTWFVVDADMVEAVDTAVGYVRGRMEELGTEDLSLEKRVRVLVGRDNCFGTADVTIDAWPELLEVDDYKNGSGVLVEVEDNYQLKSYLLGVARETNFSHERSAYAIIQPRAPHADGPVRLQEISRRELLEFEAELTEAARRVDEARTLMAEGSGAPGLFAKDFLAAGDQCRWCEAVHTCPAALAKVAETAGADFDEDPSELTAETDPTLLGRLLRWIPFLDAWARAVEKHSQRIAESGGYVDGHKMVHKGSKRRWRDGEITMPDETGEDMTIELTPEKLLEIMNDVFGVSREDMTTPPGMLTGPQAEKLVDKERRAEFSGLLLHKPDGPLTLVPESDKRPEVTVNPASGDPMSAPDLCLGGLLAASLVDGHQLGQGRGFYIGG